RLGQSPDRDFLWIADIQRPRDLRSRGHEAQHGIDQIVDIAEGPRLRAVAENADGVTAKRLHDEVRHHPTIRRMHARAERVEYPRDLDLEPVLAVVIEEEGLGA